MAFVQVPCLFGKSLNSRSTSSRNPRSVISVPAFRRTARMTATAIEKGAGMRLIKNADKETIEKLGCLSWETWGCEASTFPWTYPDDEVCLMVKGDVTVIPDDGSEKMLLKAGDIAYFPKSMSCTWEVREAVHKHFTFGIKL